MHPQKWAWAACTALSLVACGTDGSGVATAIVDQGVVDEPADPGKADYRDLGFDVVRLPTTAAGATPTRRLLVSAEDYRGVFGLEPHGVDFGREWLAYYSAGDLPSDGFAAEVRGIRLSNDWLSLKVTTALVAPGANCRPAAVRTRPQVLVKFAKPLVPTGIVSGIRADGPRACADMPPPPPPPPPPAGVVCGAATCQPGSYCSTFAGTQCLPYRTCALSGVPCGAAARCVDTPAECWREPCPPTAPTCEAYRCPAPGTIRCVDHVLVTEATACRGPYHDWIVASCAAVTFVYGH